MKNLSLILSVVALVLLRLAQVAVSVSSAIRSVEWTATHDVEIEHVRAAERHLKEGRPQEALDELTCTKVLYTYRGCYITLIRCAAHCMLDGNCDQVVSQYKPGDFTTMIHDCSELKDKLLRYCEAIKRYRGSGEAAELLDAALTFDAWLSPCSDLQLARAQYRFEGGDSLQAANLCQRLWDDGKENSWNWSYVKDDRSFKEQLQELRIKAGEGSEKWLKAREIRAFPQGRVIYLQPLGEMSDYVVQNVRARVEDFFGVATTNLPALRLTHREKSYQRAKKRYDAQDLMAGTLKRMQIPTNAFAVVMITKEMMGTPGHGWIYSTSGDVEHLISSYPWSDWNPHWQVVTIGNVAISDVSRQMGLGGLFPCITCSSGNSDAMRRVKFAYSPATQEEYRALDLEAQGKRSDDASRKLGARRSPSGR